MPGILSVSELMSSIRLRPSRILAAMLLLAHGGAAAAVIASGMPRELQAVLVLLLVANAGLAARRAALLRSPDSVIALEIAPDDALSIQTRRGDRIGCEVLGSSYVASFLVVLNLRGKDDGGTRRAVMLPDSLDPEDFRKLRVWLRWKAAAPPA